MPKDIQYRHLELLAQVCLHDLYFKCGVRNIVDNRDYLHTQISVILIFVNLQEVPTSRDQRESQLIVKDS